MSIVQLDQCMVMSSEARTKLPSLSLGMSLALPDPCFVDVVTTRNLNFGWSAKSCIFLQ